LYILVRRRPGGPSGHPDPRDEKRIQRWLGRRVDLRVDTNVSNEHTASIFTAKVRALETGSFIYGLVKNQVTGTANQTEPRDEKIIKRC
jgi:hypothetical protein